MSRGIAEILPEAAWQRCYVHFLRNALDYLPRNGDDDCLQELRWLYARRNVAEAQHDLAAWLSRWQRKYPKLTDWVEENMGNTLTFYRLPRPGAPVRQRVSISIETTKCSRIQQSCSDVRNAARACSRSSVIRKSDRQKRKTGCGESTNFPGGVGLTGFHRPASSGGERAHCNETATFC